MINHSEEQVDLLDRMRCIEPSSRKITVSFNSTDNHDAWPDELSGTIVDGLADAEAVALSPSGRDSAELAELYVINRSTRRGQNSRYLLCELQREAPGRFPFKAKRDF